MSRLEEADRLLLRSYEDANGRLDAILNLWTVVDSAGISRERAEDAHDYLIRRGLIRPRGIGGYYSLTAEAVDAVETVAAPVDRERRSADRWVLLKYCYEVADGSTRRLLNMWEVAGELGWDRSRVVESYEYLQAEGLLAARALGGLLGYNSEAVDVVDRAVADPESPTAYFPPLASMTVYIQNSFNNSTLVNTAIASPGTSITSGDVHVESGGGESALLRSALAEIRQHLLKAELTQQAKSDSLSHIEAIEEQLHKSERSPAVLRSLWGSLRDVAGEALKAAAVQSAVNTIIRLLGM